MFSIGDRVLYEGKVYVLTLFVGENYDHVNLAGGDEDIYTVPFSKLTPYVKKHQEVAQRLRTNEALEEDLVIANNKIAELEFIIKESIRLLEKSEHPFYLGIKILKEV